MRGRRCPPLGRTRATDGVLMGTGAGDNRTAIIYIAAMISRVCRWLAWPLLVAIIYVTVSPIGLRPVTPAPADLERFVAYAALGDVFCLGYPKHRLLALVSLVALAGALEALQHLVPTRHGRISDAAVKALEAVQASWWHSVLRPGIRGFSDETFDITHRRQQAGAV